MKDGSLDQVIGGVRDGDDVRACLDAGAIEKRVAERPGGRLERTPRQGLGATLGYQADIQSLTQLGHLPRNVIGAFAQRMVVMGRDEITPRLMQRDEESGGIGAARHSDEDAAGGELSHGGAGWTRTTDNAIMSRALYHLSYGTSEGDANERPGFAPSACASSSGACRWRRAFSCSFPSGTQRMAGLRVRVVAEVGFEPTTFGL